MTQYSRPQGGYYDAVTYPDCGPYSDDEWAGIFVTMLRSGGMVNTGGTVPPGLPPTPPYPNVGVFYHIAGRLAVSSPGASQIAVTYGAGMVDGRLFIHNDAIDPIAITNPAANPRIDRVVVRQNYTNAVYTSVNAPALTIPRASARLAVISGAEAVAPVAPTLVQDQDRATYWDIPLYQYQISVAGVISDLTDEREWVDADIFEIFVPALVGLDSGGSSKAIEVIDDGVNDDVACGVALADGVTEIAYGRWYTPQNYISGLYVQAIVIPLATGDVSGQILVYGNICGGSYLSSISAGAQTAVAITDNLYNCILDESIPTASNKLLSLVFKRWGGAAEDTIGDTVYCAGFILYYLGYGRN